MRALTIIALVGLSFSSAMADAPTAADAIKEKTTLEKFAKAEPSCLEWSDSCAVCARHEDGTFGCSLPGIACQPTEVLCRKPVAPEPPKK